MADDKKPDTAELHRAGEAVLRSEGGLNALRYLQKALNEQRVALMRGASADVAYDRIEALVAGLADKASEDLQEAQLSMNAKVAATLGDAVASLQALGKAGGKVDLSLLLSKGFRERIAANERRES